MSIEVNTIETTDALVFVTTGTITERGKLREYGLQGRIFDFEFFESSDIEDRA